MRPFFVECFVDCPAHLFPGAGSWNVGCRLRIQQQKYINPNPLNLSLVCNVEWNVLALRRFYPVLGKGDADEDQSYSRSRDWLIR